MDASTLNGVVYVHWYSVASYIAIASPQMMFLLIQPPPHTAKIGSM
jgi:hypothetical protein